MKHTITSSFQLNTEKLKKELWGGEFWSDGFYFATVSERGDWKSVERYVANQGKTMATPYQLKLLT